MCTQQNNKDYLAHTTWTLLSGDTQMIYFAADIKSKHSIANVYCKTTSQTIPTNFIKTIKPKLEPIIPPMAKQEQRTWWFGKRRTGCGQTPQQVEAMLLKKGYTKSITNLNTNKTQHSQFTRSTKVGHKDVLDFHPGGGDHKSNYWKAYRGGEVQGRIAPKGFENYDRIVNSPVFIDGVLMNSPK